MTSCIYFSIILYVTHSLSLVSSLSWSQLVFCFGEGRGGRICVIFHVSSEGRELEDSALWFWGFRKFLCQKQLLNRKKSYSYAQLKDFAFIGQIMDWHVCKFWAFKTFISKRKPLRLPLLFNHIFALMVSNPKAERFW